MPDINEQAIDEAFRERYSGVDLQNISPRNTVPYLNIEFMFTPPFNAANDPHEKMLLEGVKNILALKFGDRVGHTFTRRHYSSAPNTEISFHAYSTHMIPARNIARAIDQEFNPMQRRQRAAIAAMVAKGVLTEG